MLNTNSREAGITSMSNANLRETGYMLNQRAKYTANYGAVVISAANANLDGSGTLGTVLTGASNGTFIKRVIIKGQTNVTKGMVRLFLNGTIGGISVTDLIREIEIPAVTKSSIRHSYVMEISLGLYLQSGFVLKASTENAETFNVIAEGLDMTYPP